MAATRGAMRRLQVVLEAQVEEVEAPAPKKQKNVPAPAPAPAPVPVAAPVAAPAGDALLEQQLKIKFNFPENSNSPNWNLGINHHLD